MARRREINIFSMSFLDCLCCALGAIVTLLLIAQQMNVNKELAIRRTEEALNQIGQAEHQAKKDRQTEKEVEEQIRRMEGKKDVDAKLLRELVDYLDSLRKVRFTGIQTNKKNLVIVVDLSGSMQEHDAVLRRAAKALIDLFRWDVVQHRFNIVTYQTDENEAPALQVWREGNALHPADKDAREDAKAWIDRVAAKDNLKGNTPTVTAFRRALQFEGAECFFLLTDGEPTDGESTPELDRLKEQDEEKWRSDAGRLASIRKQIHAMKMSGQEIRCFGIGERVYEKSGVFKAFLESLADPTDFGFVGL